MTSQDDAHIAKFKQVTVLKYEDQGKFFLNAFWKEFSGEAEKVWAWCRQFEDLDLDKKKAGNDLDEFTSHRFLEKNGETKGVVELRETLRTIDKDFNKRMALVEYLLFKFKVSIKDLVTRPQGVNEELAKAQQALEGVQVEIQKIESKKAELEQKAQGTGVKAMQAKNELEQLLMRDNTDLNRAVLSAEAAMRKAQKAGGEEAQGALWWAERELQEMKKYKPKGGLKHTF